MSAALLQVINGAAKTWGLECLRYEIKDIVPPDGIVKAMELQAEAERRKRAQVLESEGVRQATINESEAQRVRSPKSKKLVSVMHACTQRQLYIPVHACCAASWNLQLALHSWTCSTGLAGSTDALHSITCLTTWVAPKVPLQGCVRSQTTCLRRKYTHGVVRWCLCVQAPARPGQDTQNERLSTITGLAVEGCCSKQGAVVQEAAINRAIGESQSIQRRAEATANGVKMIAGAITGPGGKDAVSMYVAQQYVDAFAKIAKEGNTMIVPADASNVASMIATATSVFKGTAGMGGGGSVASGGEDATTASKPEKRGTESGEAHTGKGVSVLDGVGSGDAAPGNESAWNLQGAVDADMLQRMMLHAPGQGSNNAIGFSLSK